MSRREDPPANRRQSLAVRAAHLYYVQDLDMAAIGRELGMSRSSVSRLLAHARESGIVDIRIVAPSDRSGEIAADVAGRFDIAASVVPTTAQMSEADRLERVGQAGGRLASGVVGSDMVVGVAWGATVSVVSRHLVSSEAWNMQIVQLNGAGNPATTGIDYASEILQRFGTSFSARVEQFPVPAFFDDPDTKRALWRERSTRRVLDAQARMDVAVFGLGSPFADVPSHVYSGGYLDPADFDSLHAERVVGDVATVFYRQDGSAHGIELNSRSSGPDLDTLRRVPRRICVVSGEAKVGALEGALSAGLITDLVVDENLARLLIRRSGLHRAGRTRP